MHWRCTQPRRRQRQAMATNRQWSLVCIRTRTQTTVVAVQCTRTCISLKPCSFIAVAVVFLVFAACLPPLLLLWLLCCTVQFVWKSGLMGHDSVQTICCILVSHTHTYTHTLLKKGAITSFASFHLWMFFGSIQLGCGWMFG